MIDKFLEQVTARWRPEDSCRPDLEDAPVFYPTEEVSVVTLTVELFQLKDLAVVKPGDINQIFFNLFGYFPGVSRYAEIYC